MAGRPTLQVLLEDATGAFTHDITQFVRVSDGWDLTRGRNDEDDSISPGSLRLRLDNTDGRFSLDSPSYSGIKVDKRLRLVETFDGTSRTRFTGYVQEWPTRWESALANLAYARITVVDRLARLNRRELRSVIENEILADKPFAYYMLNEPAGATAAVDTSGRGAPALPVDGSPPPILFGSGTGPGTDGLTAAQFQGEERLFGPLPNAASTGVTFECFFVCPAVRGDREQILMMALWFSPSGTIQEQLLRVTPAGYLYGAGIVTTKSVADGLTHHVAYVSSGTSRTLYLDGQQIGTASGAFSTWTHLAVGTWLIGTMSHVAVSDQALSATRVAAHAAAGRDGFSTERTDQRIARLANYAGITAADQNLETGVAGNIPVAATSGQTVSTAMDELVDAEGGALFLAGDGRLTFHNRSHRVLTATQAPKLSIAAADIDPDVEVRGDKDYLFNTVTGTRKNSTEQRIENAASIAMYDAYSKTYGTLLLSTDGEVLNLLNWTAARYSTVRPRVSMVKLDLMTLPTATVAAALALELGDRVAITSMPAQAPAASLDLIVEGLKESQSQTSWELTLNTAPAELFRAFILDDTSFGVLDSSTPLLW